MVDPFEDKSADAVCTISYMNNNLSRPQIFMGRTKGIIVRPRGVTNFGWDPIFQPD
jgi:inosine triphosphate pyrophosphatase